MDQLKTKRPDPRGPGPFTYFFFFPFFFLSFFLLFLSFFLPISDLSVSSLHCSLKITGHRLQCLLFFLNLPQHFGFGFLIFFLSSYSCSGFISGKPGCNQSEAPHGVSCLAYVYPLSSLGLNKCFSICWISLMPELTISGSGSNWSAFSLSS